MRERVVYDTSKEVVIICKDDMCIFDIGVGIGISILVYWYDTSKKVVTICKAGTCMLDIGIWFLKGGYVHA